MVKNEEGFTLVELLIAVSIFALLSVIISGIYLAFSKSQARTKVSQSLLNDAQYILETVAKEIKNNEIVGIGTSGDTDIYTLKKENGDLVYFEYHWLTSLRYGLDDDDEGWWIDLNDDDDFKITYFNIYLNPDNFDENEQPRVTISLRVDKTSTVAYEKVFYNLQTTVSSRIYKR